MIIKYIILVYISLFLNGFLWAGETQFPLRKKYKDVPTISHEALYQKLGRVLVIDVRSAYEYETLRINGAINVSVSNKGFILELKKIREKDARPIVFYCNGITCSKSYKAVIKAQKHKIANITAFDLGIIGWAKAHPDAATLLEETPVILSKLISKAKFLAHMISPDEFVKKIDDNAMVLDIREPVQRDIVILDDIVRVTPSDRIGRVLQRAKTRKKTLLIFDAVGKQVRWLQYRLEKEHVENYYFMKGGVKGFVKKS